MKKKILILSFLCLAFAHAEAALSLNIDTSAQTAFFSGTTSGTPRDVGDEMVGPYYLMVWGEGQSYNYRFFMDDAIVGDETAPGAFVHVRLGLSSDIGVSLYIDAFTYLDYSELLTGTGIVYDYSGLNDEAIQILESAIGSDLPIYWGTGYEAVSVEAVPEPDTYAACFGVLCLLALGWRRLRRRPA
jgi:hypothetical protein